MIRCKKASLTGNETINVSASLVSFYPSLNNQSDVFDSLLQNIVTDLLFSTTKKKKTGERKGNLLAAGNISKQLFSDNCGFEMNGC